MKNSGLAIFASGRGSNAAKIIERFREEDYSIACIVSNKANAGVLDLARENHIPELILDRNTFYNTEDIVSDLKSLGVKSISLAGFLWLVPQYLVSAFADRIINIHPALLPKYGGKGMYGSNVHKAVKEAGDLESGLTIHLVNEEYDKGEILYQASCKLLPEDSAEDIAKKVLQLEHKFYPEVLFSFMEFIS
jgi:phosphoribosylglycinamide formyltransferase-1